MTVTLRPYQQDAVDAVRRAYAEGARAPLLVAATGAGKTVMFSYIARNAAARGSRVLILAHRDILIRQASGKLTDNEVPHGIIMADHPPQPHQLVQVASVQTMVRRLTDHRPYDLIVVDEAHLSAAASYQRVVHAFPQARLLGVTGSPVRLDGKGLGYQSGGLYDQIILGPSTADLIEQGYLARPVYYAAKTRPDLTGVRVTAGDYNQADIAQRMDRPSITGDVVEHYQRLADGVPAVAFCTSVEHARNVAAQFNAAGIAAMSLTGEDDAKAREVALSGLARGRIKVVTSVGVLIEGMDCPAIGAVILLRPTKSTAAYLQMIGRGLRPHPGKDRCLVLDHAGCVFLHGLAEDPREWSLDGEKKKSRAANDNPEPVRQCEKCYAVFKPRAECPQCGHVHAAKPRRIAEVDGDLEEIKAEQLRKERQQEVGKARTLEELFALAAARGYSRGWAYKIYQARHARRRYA